LGMGKVAAMDIGAVCSGFVYALATGAGLIATGIASDVLVVGADTMSTVVHPEDRDTAVIFGDGAGAVVLRAGSPTDLGALGLFDLGSDGELADRVAIPAGGSRQRASGMPAPHRDFYLIMEGKTIFRQAVERM